jgi:deoxyribodipyrimidine photo-lyase
MSLHVVWLKRDLRLSDHEPLRAALLSGLPVAIVVLFEPSMERLGSHSKRHRTERLRRCAALKQELAAVGATDALAVFSGEAIDVFAAIHERFGIASILAHEETGVEATWMRDRAIALWCRHQNIPFVEFPSGGIVRRLSSFSTWEERWLAHAEASIPDVDLSILARRGVHLGDALQTLDVVPAEGAGTNDALRMLTDWLGYGHRGYRRAMAQPALAERHCSRLSAHIAWGSISVRQVWQCSKDQGIDRASVASFRSRLRWRDHFIQKFEGRPSMEYRNVNPAFDATRTTLVPHTLSRWEQAETGYPLVDACMRCLQTTGWITFRMRAMLVSFVTHHLWQPWQAASDTLASLFIDFEPGIHYAQMQMQAGTTGLHTLRIYNPIVQAEDNDAQATFITRWLPELARLPVPYRKQPWLLSPIEAAMLNFRLGIDYPERIVDVETTGRHARDVLWQIIRSDASRRHAARILATQVVSKTRRP